MKLGALVALIGIMVMTLGTCCYSSGPTKNTPEIQNIAATIYSFMEAAANLDSSKAKVLLTEESLKPFQEDMVSSSSNAVYIILTSGKLKITSIDVQGDKARVRLMTATGSTGLELNLVCIDGKWRIIYPSDGSGRISSATTSGNKDTALLVSMISDGVLSDQEKTELEPILKNYYAIQLITKLGEYKIREYIPANIKELDKAITNPPFRHALTSTNELSEAMTEHPKPSDAVLWKVPDEKTQKESAKLAKIAVDGIYKELAAAKDKYSELNTFTKDKVKLSDSKDKGFDYNPVKPNKEMMSAKPCILIHISAGFDNKYPETILPAQMLQIRCIMLVDDKKLKAFVNQVVTKHIQPLLDREKTLGGEPGLFNMNL